MFWLVLSFIIPNKVFWRQFIFQKWAGLFVAVSRIKITVIGTPPRPPFFLVANHLGYADIPVLRSVASGIFVAKGEIQQWPIVGTVVKNMGNIFIDRTNRRDIPRAGNLILQHIADGEGVMIFPEGTSSIGANVLNFNSSFLQFAAQAELKVSYVTLNYRTANEPIPVYDSYAWWDDIGIFRHMHRIFCAKDPQVTLIFGDESISSTDRKLLATELHDRVTKNFIPLV